MTVEVLLPWDAQLSPMYRGQHRAPRKFDLDYGLRTALLQAPGPPTEKGHVRITS